jgi:glycosyltransferase involved in cell wall biosynthesis
MSAETEATGAVSAVAVRAVSVIIPAFNEHESILSTIETVTRALGAHGWVYEIIVIDDGSRDGTGDIASQAAITVIRHRRNRGYGASIKTGLKRASHDLIAITDADGTYPSEELPALLDHVAECDMVVGARTGANAQVPLLRRPAKWFLRSLASYLMAQRIPDINSGLRVFRREAALRFLKLYPDGFSFTTTITLALMSNGYVVEYRPIDYFKRQGLSKIRPIRDTIRFTTLTIRTVMYFQPLKVFGPLSAVILGWGLVTTSYHAVVSHDITTSDLVLLLGGLNVLAIGLLADLIDKRTS